MRRAIAIVLVLALLSGCGSDHDHSTPKQPRGTAADRGFVNDMTPHHEAAVEMAAIAERRAEHSEVKRLAAAIATSQQDEIDQMARMAKRLETGGPGATLGLSEHAMGMEMHAADLEDARPFDRAFIDAMVPHHQGAIAMSRVELRRGGDPEARALARRIIAAQRKEIAQMRRWRKRWYGGERSTAKPSAGGHMQQDHTGGHMAGEH